MDGKAFIYRRTETGNFFVSLWVPSAKRSIKASLKSANEETAKERAMTFVLDKLASEKAGINVFSGTLADLIDAWEKKQRERLARGEIRNEPRIVRVTHAWRKHFPVVFGPIDQIKLAAMTNERWQDYVSYRSKQLKLSGRRFGFEPGSPANGYAKLNDGLNARCTDHDFGVPRQTFEQASTEDLFSKHMGN